MMPRTKLGIGALVVCFAVCGLGACGALAQQDPPDKKPPQNRQAEAAQTQANDQAKVETEDQAPATTQPVSRPTTSPTTSPATQAALGRLEKMRAMREAAAKNGKQPGDQAQSKPKRETASERLARLRAEREKRRRELGGVRNAEQLRRSAMQSAARRKVAENEQENAADRAGAKPVDAARRAGRAAQQPQGAEPRTSKTDVKRDMSLPRLPRARRDPETGLPLEMKAGAQTPGKGVVEPDNAQAADAGAGAKQAAAETKPAGGAQPATSAVAAKAEEETPVEPPPARADGRNYTISFSGMPWEDVIEYYRKIVGKPLMPDLGVMPGGELTYESTRRFTKDEMLDELNFLLAEQNYFMAETDDYLYVLPLNELGKYLDPDTFMFNSFDEFDHSEVRDLQFASVLFPIKDRKAEDVRDMLAPSMPDRALPVVVGDTNAIRITGLGRDVRRFHTLMEKASNEEYDPAETRFIKVETSVSSIERMVRDYFKIGQAERRYNRETRKFETVGGAQGGIIVIPDERTKNLIIKATPAKLDKIEKFIKEIDQKPDLGEFVTTVLAVKYGSAVDIANLLNQILAQEQGRARTPLRTTRTPTRTTSRSRQPIRNVRTTNARARTPTPEDIIVEDIYERAKKTVRIVADGRTNNLIVYANEDGLKRVTEILDQIDQPVPSNFKTIVLEHADAEKIQPTVENIARGMSGNSSRRGAARGASIVADAALNALHVVAEREQMTRIEGIIKQLDVEGPDENQHVIETVNLPVARAAEIANRILGVSQAGPRNRAQRGSRAGVRTAANEKVIPLDEAGILVVICTDEEWKEVEEFIRLADENAISDRPQTEFFEVARGNARSIANTLSQLYRNYQHPVLGRSQVFIDTVGTQIVAHGVKPALDEIGALVKSLDMEASEDPLVLIPLQYADATQVAQIAQGLLPAGTGSRRGGRTGGGGASLQAEPTTNSLVVKADKLTLQRITDFAKEMDAKVSAAQPERKYYSLKNASAREVISAIQQIFGASGGRGSRGRGPVGTQIKAIQVGSQVVVDAPATKQSEIATLIEQLDSLADQGITTMLIKLPGANVSSIAQRLTRAFSDQVRKQGVVARFEADTSTESILVTLSKDVREQAEGLLTEYKTIAEGLINETQFYQLKNATANEVSTWLKGELVTLMTKQFGRAAAQQVKVTADNRTNRIIISAPQVAVKAAEPLLEQYDVPSADAPKPAVEVWTVKLAGLDVRNLASQLQRALQNMPRRPDGLRAVVTSDQLTDNLIVSAPKDMKAQIDELVGKFTDETLNLIPEQKFIPVKNADANYIASQLRSILAVQIRGRRGDSVWNRVNIQVDTRQNQIVINAPKFAIEMALPLIVELDKESAGEQIRTIALNNADANTVYGILRTIYNEKLRAKTLQISVEPLTNALIVGGSNEDFDEIKKWAEQLDNSAADAGAEQEIFELKNANPWEVNTVLQQTFVQKGVGRKVPPSKLVKTAIVAGRSIVVTAPSEKMLEIENLIKRLDEIGVDQAVVKTYTLAGMGTALNQFARQIEKAVNVGMAPRERRVSVAALPARDTLIVTAMPEKLPLVEQAMEEFKDLFEPAKMESIKLKHADANAVYQALNRVLQPKIRAGKMSLSVETMTNALIVSASETDMAEIRDWAGRFDDEVGLAILPPRIFELENASPYEVRNILMSTFVPTGGKRRGGIEIRFDVLGGRSIVAKAPAERMADIEALIEKLDAVQGNKARIKVYKVPGMGTKLTQFARDIQNAVNSQVQARERRISVVANPSADALVVTALEDQYELIQSAMDQFKELYKPQRIETITLANGDANQIYQSLNRVLQPKIRAGKIQISVETMTNALIVMAADEEIAEIREWALKLDEMAKDSIVAPRIFELENANPWEVANILNVTFVPPGTGRKRGGSEIRFDIVGGRSLVVKAPADKMKDIEALIKQLDEIGAPQVEVRTYTLAGMGSRELNDLSRQLVNNFNAGANARERRISVSAYAPADALIVTAQTGQFPKIEKMMDQFKGLVATVKAKTEFFKLEFVDAGQIVNVVRDLVRSRLKGEQRGSRAMQNFNVSADPRTNRLIVYAPESVIPDVQEVISQLDIDVPDLNQVATIELKYADPGEVRNMINDVFGNRGRRQRDSADQQVYVTVSNNTLIVKAPPKKREAIEKIIADIDKEDSSGLQIKTFDLRVLQATQIAGQVQMFLRSVGGVTRKGQMQPGAFAEPTTNTLVVIAPADKLPFIEALISQIESKEIPEGEPRTYALVNVRADQIARNVEQMLRAKVAEREGARRNSVQVAVMAEPSSNQLVVLAPESYQELAKELIDMIDAEVLTGEIVHLIPLDQADAPSLAQTISKIASKSGVRGGAPKVVVTADAGSNTILLKGLPKDVADMEKMVKELEVKSDTVPELQIFQLENTAAYDVSESLAAIFPPGRSAIDTVIVAADENYNRLLVTASKRKMRQVEAFVERLDAPVMGEDSDLLPGNKKLYFVDVFRGDAFNIAFDVSDFFPSSDSGGPLIDSDLFGEYIKVVCRPNEFPKIEGMIREFDRRARVETTYRFLKPKGDLARLLPLLESQYGKDLIIEQASEKPTRATIVEDLWAEDETPPGAPKTTPKRGAPDGTQPFMISPFDEAWLNGETSPPVAMQDADKKPGSTAQDSPPASPSSRADEPELKRETVKVTVLPDGRLSLSGPSTEVDEVEDAIDLLQEDLGIGEVIRIFHFRYGDVNAASRILDMMFNERQVRVQQPQQQRGRQGQQPQGAQGQKGAQRGGDGKKGGDQQGGLMAQLQQAMGGGGRGGQQQGGGRSASGGQRVRIATDSSHNYIIVKTDEAMLPDIRELLRELDIPPGEVRFEVFPLRNLDARETAENIKAVLGLGKSTAARRQPKAQAGRNQQQQLMQILQQQMLSVGGTSAKVENVEIVPNAITNSILVSAPPDVVEMIRKVISDLEGLEGHDVVVIEYYKLNDAKVDDVLPLLKEIFAGAIGGGRGGKGGGSANPASLGPVSISGDPRSNTLVFSAQAKDVKVVRKQIEMLDIDGPLAEVEMYVCQYGDAAGIAQTVAEVLQRSAGGGRGGRGGANGSSPGMELRITAEPMTNTVLVYGPLEKRDLAFEKIKQLDEFARREIRRIAVKVADPEKLAAKLSEMFGGSSAIARSGRGGRRGGGVAQAMSRTSGRLLIVGSKDAGVLFVRAPEPLYKQIEEMVTMLDVPSGQLKIRRYALQYANAQVVVDSVKGALTEFMMAARSLGGGQGGDLGLDAFTAVADPRTNSVLVVGSEQTFGFIEAMLTSIDMETPLDQMKQLEVFVLREADALTVADAINQVATGTGAGQSGSGNSRPQGRGGRGMPSMPGAGGGLSTAPQFNVQAVAEPATNSVLVYGKPDDIERIKEMVIDPLEAAVQMSLAVVPIERASATQVASLIAPLVDQRAAEGRQVSITPNEQGKSLIVWANRADAAWVRDLVALYDNPDITPDGDIKIIPVPFGQDAAALAAQVERIVNDGERIIADKTGVPPRQIVIASYEHQIMARGDRSLYPVVELAVQQITKGAGKPVFQVIELSKLSAQEAMDAIYEIQAQRRTNRSSQSRGSSLRTSGGTGSRGIRIGGSSNRGRSTNRGVPANRGGRSSGSRLGPSRSRSNRTNRTNRPPQRPSGRRGSWLWNPGPNFDQPVGTPVSSGAPFVGLFVMQDQDADENTRKPDPPVAAVPASTSAPTSAPTARPLNALTGMLRGDVIATPLGDRRIMITGDENDVAFIMRMLALMEEKTPEAELMVFPLANAQAAALVPILQDTVQAWVQATGGGATRSSQFSIVAESRSNSLIVTATEEIMAQVARILDVLDVDGKTGHTQVRMLALHHIRADEAAQQLKPVMERLYRIREVPAEAQASIEPVQRSNALMVVGIPSDIDEIERMLEGLDIELEGESDFTVARGVVIELKNAQAEDIATTLSTLIEVQRSGAQGAAANASIVRKLILSKETGEELTPIDLDRPIRILADKGTNAIIIFSTPDNNSALTEIAGLFDTPPEGVDIDVKSFPLKHANAEQVATMLKDMFDNVRKNVLKRLSDGEGNRAQGVMPPVSQGLAPKGLPYPVEVVFDARSNTVFIVGQSDAVLLAAGLINEMDKSSDALNVQPYVIPLKSIAVTNLKDQLDEVLSKRLAALGGDANAARDSAIITPDDRSNSLIVVATPEMYEMVADLAEQLDSAQSYRMVDSQFRQMEFADATKLAGMLQQVFDAKEETAQKTGTQAKDTLKVLADSRSNSIVMTGTRDYLKEAVGLIERLDQQMTSPLEVKVRPVVLNSAANIATLLDEMIQQARSEQAQEVRGMPIHIAADTYSNNLLLAASREDMQMLEAWIDVLDRPSEPGRVVKVIPLARGDAEALAQSAQELFQTAGQGASSDVTITNDPTTNSVVAIGPPKVVHDIEEFVTKLNDTEIRGVDAVRVFRLAQADAEDAGNLLRSILEGRSGSIGGTTSSSRGSSGSGSQDSAARKVMLVFQREHEDLGMETLRGMRNDITVIDDLRTNSLVVAAPTESMGLVESLIEAIDQPPTAVNVRMLPLYNSDAEQMVTMLDELFKTSGTSTGGGGGASGGGAEPVIALGEGAEGGRQTLSFTTDVRTNSVIAAGTPGYLDLVEELVLKLDSQEMKARRTIVYQPRNNTALAIQQAIADFNDREQQLLSDLQQDMSASQRMSRQIIAVASEDANRVLLSFDPRREQDLFDLVRDLDQPPPQVMIQVLIVEVSMDNSLELGVEFALQDLQFAKAGPTDTNTFDFVAGTDIGAAGTGLGGFTFTIGGSDFNFLFRTLQNEGSLNVLSRPQIVAMDNQEASIEIVNDVPFVTSSALNTGGNVVTQIDREEIGIKLTVTPQINPDGFVRMAIEQEVSDLTGSTVDVGQGVTAPIFFRRNANTTVTVMDGETVVLGGLITTRDETREQKVPLLGDIPGLGLLFRNDVTTERRTELLVILTPRVVRSVEDYRDLSIRERDRMTVFSNDVLTSPLMGDLQVEPDELAPENGGDMMGPFPKGTGSGGETKDEDVYGPTRTNADKPKSNKSGSYDIPLTRRLSRAASAGKP